MAPISRRDAGKILMAGAAGQVICRGFLRFDQEGTRKTPRERCIVMRYPWGIPYMSDGGDGLVPDLG